MLLSLIKRHFVVLFAVLNFAALTTHANVCEEHLLQIKYIPYEAERGVDAHYDAIVAAGRSAVPCLIANVTNTRGGPNPRPIPGYGHPRVGDTALYLLSCLTGLEPEKMLPRRYQDLYKDMGVLVVDKYLQDRPGNRRLLQRKLWHCYRTTYLPSLRKGAT